MRVKKCRPGAVMLLPAILLAFLVLTGCGIKTAAKTGYHSLDDFGGKRIGVVTGAIQGPIIEKEIPTAKLSYFNTVPDLLAAARSGKIDAFSATDSIIRFLMLENDDLTYLDEPLTETMDIGVIFPRTEAGTALRSEFNEYLAEAKKTGVPDEIESIWLGQDGAKTALPDISGLSGENGTLVLATDTSMAPYSFVKGSTYAGMDIDNIVRFCKARGYAVEIMDMSFSGIVDAVAASKCDFAAGAIAYTKERAESVDFSDPVFHCYSVIAYLSGESKPAVGNSGFLQSVQNSFEKTFFRENRWMLFLKGIATTLLITAVSILLGTLSGFGVFMLCRNGNPVANTITRFCVWLVRGMPVVVLLMILYYIIFGNVTISATAVAIIGFTLVFGAGVYGMIRTGVNAVDKGQIEAAYTLGYTDRKAFMRFILPQAMPHFMPAYKNSVTELIKATAVVGYVAVEDLTKVGDIVRSRTYEAFFPLIAVAIIYFILAAILTFVVNQIERHLDPMQRSKEKIRREVEGL